jgi:enoyl-CoA hydratase/carnithine racemase
LSLAERLAAMAPNAVACTKELLEQAPRRSLHEQLAVERDQFIDKLFHANGEEGLAAFLEKRAPRFR